MYNNLQAQTLSFYIEFNPDESIRAGTILEVYLQSDTPGKIYYTEASSECELNNFECAVKDNANNTVENSPMEYPMIDQGNNNYIAYTAMPRPGKVSFVFKRYAEGGVHFDYWDNENFSGDRVGTGTSQTIDTTFEDDDALID